MCHIVIYPILAGIKATIISQQKSRERAYFYTYWTVVAYSQLIGIISKPDWHKENCELGFLMMSCLVYHAEMIFLDRPNSELHRN